MTGRSAVAGVNADLAALATKGVAEQRIVPTLAGSVMAAVRSADGELRQRQRRQGRLLLLYIHE